MNDPNDQKVKDIEAQFQADIEAAKRACEERIQEIERAYNRDVLEWIATDTDAAQLAQWRQERG
jgi:hypothetical protein